MTTLSSNLTESFNPATGEFLGSSPLHNREELAVMIKAARDAQLPWEKIGVGKRKTVFNKIRKFIIANADRISDTISSENGKSPVDALATEVLPATMALSFYTKNCVKFLRPKRLKGGNIALVNKRSYQQRIPFGVVGIISPWNYPFAIAFSEVIMGLLAGNAVILKTATETQLTGLILKEAVEAAGLPDGLFQFINIPGRIAGDAFLELGIDKLFFTGSVPVGKKLMAKAAETLTPVCLELGGNDAMIVCGDADPVRAAGGAVWAGFQNAGQSCGGVERIYVHEKIYDRFMKELAKKTKNLKPGPTSAIDTELGCLTTEKQRKAVQVHIDEALEMGAEIFARSETPEGINNFIPATVLTNVNHEMMVMKDETFGPVVGVMKVSSDEEAIKLANDSYLGLTGSVWSKNSGRAKKTASKDQSGNYHDK